MNDNKYNNHIIVIEIFFFKKNHAQEETQTLATHTSRLSFENFEKKD